MIKRIRISRVVFVRLEKSKKVGGFYYLNYLMGNLVVFRKIVILLWREEFRLKGIE